jgi:hypothetical protein
MKEDGSIFWNAFETSREILDYFFVEIFFERFEIADEIKIKKYVMKEM